MDLDDTTTCEVPAFELTQEEIEGILKQMRTIAIVGISDKPDRPSYGVARYLQYKGFKIIPINPSLSQAFGEAAYPDLKAIPKELYPIDVVDIFRKPETVPGIVRDAIALGAKVIWMQEGVVNNQAAEEAKAAGLQVVMNKCLKKVHIAFSSDKSKK